MQRDRSIDNLRGFAMVWVLVVHALYWGNFFTQDTANLVRSFCLFEMPLFFFVTGAASGLRRPEDAVSFVFRRFQRILVPYWVFGLIAAALAIVRCHQEGTVNLVLDVKIVLSWLLPINRQAGSLPHITSAVWFVPVYLCVVLLIPLFWRMKCSAHPFFWGGALAGVFAATALAELGWIQYVAFYGLWTYVGLFYREIRASKRLQGSWMWLFAAGAGAVCALHIAGMPLDMQENKFPPNLMFFAYSAMMMALLPPALPLLDAASQRLERHSDAGKLAALFSRRSLTIFLYQPFVFNLSIPFANLVVPGDSTPAALAKVAICVAVTVPLCALSAVVFGNVERVRLLPEWAARFRGI